LISIASNCIVAIRFLLVDWLYFAKAVAKFYLQNSSKPKYLFNYAKRKMDIAKEIDLISQGT